MICIYKWLLTIDIPLTQPIRKLSNFESPYLTLYTENERSVSAGDGTYLILVRKSYWDTNFDEDLYGDKAALNIIYWQALHEVEKGHVLASKETRNRLTTLQAMGDKVEVWDDEC